MRQILLASKSPRRREILQAMGLPFVLVLPGVEDSSQGHADWPGTVAARAARSKAEGARFGKNRGLLLAVDSIVALDHRIFGKPKDRAEAERFLLALEGRCHEVWTAMAMTIVDGPQQDLTELCEIQEKAIVSMRQLGQEERSAYLESGDWHDKAGGYGIQTAARTFVELVSGEIDTVIGLPSAVLLRYWEAYSAGRSLAHVEH